jgi:2-dehydro-3-deoxyphosphogluconate aldolase/(4S)-4-hydroxy-2-oxoglutarate aldolase
MDKIFLGELGHIGIKTNNVGLAKEYLSEKGIEFNMETAKYDQDGNLTVIYLKNDIGGFAFHLMQKK